MRNIHSQMYIHHQLWPPTTIEWRVKQAETVIHRAKPVALLRKETWGTGWLESRPQRESLSGLGASSPVPPWQRN